MKSLMRFATVVWALLVFGSGGTSASTRSLEERLAHANRILTEVPLIDGHNDLPFSLRVSFKNELAEVLLDRNISALPEDISRNMRDHTDWVKMRAGKVGGQFWSAYTNCKTQYKNALKVTLEQFDVIHRMVAKYPDILEFVTTADGILDAHKRGKIASLIGVEGGHSMDNSLAALRLFYTEGARYMTITHRCNTPWADNSFAEDNLYKDEGHVMQYGGISPWGELVIKEMNRLGMFVDLSHVAQETMDDAFRLTIAPVIFSHSSARAVCNHTRNVPDSILRRMPENGGVVMVAFVKHYVKCDGDDSPPTIHDVIKHINYIRDVAGIDHVGIGGNYNGVPDFPIGVEDASTYPAIFAELLKDPKWTEEDLKKLAGLNLIRAFREVERVRDELVNVPPYDKRIPTEDMKDYESCQFKWY